MTSGARAGLPSPADVSSPPAGRFALCTWNAAFWTLRSLHAARRSLRRRGLDAHVVPPSHLPWAGRRGVAAVIRRCKPTCLERAIVLQAWLTAHGHHHDVVVGVAARDGKMTAHAWLEVDRPPPDAHGYLELHRLPARSR